MMVVSDEERSKNNDDAEDKEDKKYFSDEKMYEEYLENGYFSYTTSYGLFKEAY